MTPFSSSVIRNGVAAWLLIGIAGCSGGGKDDSDESDPLAGAPKVGTCHQLTEADVYGMSTEAATVDCDDPHNSYTYHVGRLANAAEETPGTFARQKCRELLPDVVGLPAEALAPTSFDLAAFQPSVEQEEAGASWFRCELVAHSEGWAFKELPPGEPPYFNGTAVPDTYRSCIDATRTGNARVTCDMRHTHRWSGSFAGPKEMPTSRGLVSIAERRCPEIADTKHWYAAWPQQRDWDAGLRVISCYTPEDTLTE